MAGGCKTGARARNPACTLRLPAYDDGAMINFIDLRYARLGTPDLDTAVRFATELH